MRHTGILGVLLLSSASLAWGQPAGSGLPHADPERDAQVPVAGWPTWIEDLTIGSPVSDFGSHAGVKATVTGDDPIPARAALNMAHYSGFQVVGAQVDQSLLYLVERGATGSRPVLAPPAARQVRFHPWGWEETAVGDELEVRGAVTTLGTDAFLVVARIENRAPVARTLAPRLAFVADGDGVHEGMHPLHVSWIKRWSASRQGNAALIKFRRGTIFTPLAWDRQRFVRLVQSDLPLERVEGGLQPFARARRWATTLHLAERTLAPGGALELGFVIACGADEAEARAVLQREQGALAAPAQALARVLQGWRRDLDALPRPHAAFAAAPGADEARLFRMAYAGLRMNRYAARERLGGTQNTAAKMHFNAFFVWDAAIAALAESNWDPALSREIMRELFRAQQPEGHLHYAVDAGHRPVNGMIRGTSQPPVHGWVMERILERGGLDRPWLTELYARSQDYLAWFERERDRDRDGVFGFGNALETGWDDTPRYPGLHPAPSIDVFGIRLVLGNLSGLLPVSDVEALDLNCWLVSYYRAMARSARELGRPAAEAQGWERRANELAARVEAALWDPVTGTYRDTRTRRGVATPVRTDTPVVAWPLFLGVSRDPARVRSTVQRYLLDPSRAFGDPDDPGAPRFPVPSVGYQDPAYDHATDGYYWRGQSWLVPAYAATEALYKYGWEDEARELKRRILRGVVRAAPGGIYETYDALSGRIGFGSGSLTGAGEPAAFLIGLSCAPVAELLLDRHERERLVGHTEARFGGHVHDAWTLETDRLLYRVAFSPRGLLPRSELRTRDGAPLVAPTARGLELTITDPAGNLGGAPARVTLPGKGGWSVWAIGPAGARPVPAPATGPDLVLDLPRTDAGTVTSYVLLPPGSPAP